MKQPFRRVRYGTKAEFFYAMLILLSQSPTDLSEALRVVALPNVQIILTCQNMESICPSLFSLLNRNDRTVLRLVSTDSENSNFAMPSSKLCGIAATNSTSCTSGCNPWNKFSIIWECGPDAGLLAGMVGFIGPVQIFLPGDLIPRANCLLFAGLLNSSPVQLPGAAGFSANIP